MEITPTITEKKPLSRPSQRLQIRRALLSVSDKTELLPLAQALAQAGSELVATGNTARQIQASGLTVRGIEDLSKNPEAFQGRMKTLSFPVCSGILFRREDSQDLEDARRLGVQPIDCVVVNFYPFEKTLQEQSSSGSLNKKALIEQIDIGGPTLVRAAAKNAPDVLVLTDPSDYAEVIQELKAHGSVGRETVQRLSQKAWDCVAAYDQAISQGLKASSRQKIQLRYGENPHQKGWVVLDADPAINWSLKLTDQELSYNNILDVSAAYDLVSECILRFPEHQLVTIIKHNNPCGVAAIPKNLPHAQLLALKAAWEGDPVSAFGGVVLFSEPLEMESADWLAQRFIELVASPRLSEETLKTIQQQRKKLKAVEIRRWASQTTQTSIGVPGGLLCQSSDFAQDSPLKSVTERAFPKNLSNLANFGNAICRVLKSNAIAIVRALPEIPQGMQLIGAGQGQPNRVEALRDLAIPRAKRVVPASELSHAVLVSDAFFPFRDGVDEAAAAGIRWVVQPGGSLRDSEVIQACNENGIAMAMTGIRHFRH